MIGVSSVLSLVRSCKDNGQDAKDAGDDLDQRTAASELARCLHSTSINWQDRTFASIMSLLARSEDRKQRT